MESLRRHEKTSIQTEMRNIKVYNTRDTTQLSIFKTGTSSLFNDKQVEKLSFKINERNERNDYLIDRLQKLSDGDLDTEIKDRATKITNDINEKNEEKKKKKREIEESKEHDKIKSKEYFNANVKLSRQDKNGKRDYKHFKKACAGIPGGLLTKLSKLPNNKGFIWKGVHCYGDLDDSGSSNVSLTERKYNDPNFYLHEWTQTNYTLSTKPRNGPKKIIETRKRHTKV
jgi:hypothetical protein